MDHIEEHVKKVRMGYLLAYILLPIAGLLLLFTLTVLFVENGTAAFLIFTVPTVLTILWWSLFGSMLYDRRRKRMIQELDDQGFVRNHTFESDSCTVMVDRVHRSLGLLFRWNPYQTYVLPISLISKAWVDDGCGGPGFLRGTSRVSFVFIVDGVTVRVNTFTSNQRWRPDSDKVLTGISKADLMVEVLNGAREGAV